MEIDNFYDLFQIVHIIVLLFVLVFNHLFVVFI